MHAPLTDALESVRGYVDAQSNILSNMTYTPYGVPDTPITGFAFTGEQRDSNALQYHRARYYAPSLGIFSSLDPWEGLFDRPMSLNGYSWVEGNVVNLTDPSGEEAVPPYIPYPHHNLYRLRIYDLLIFHHALAQHKPVCVGEWLVYYSIQHNLFNNPTD